MALDKYSLVNELMCGYCFLVKTKSTSFTSRQLQNNTPKCRDCVSSYGKEYRLKNEAKLQAKSKSYYDNNLSKIKLYSKNNRKRISENHKLYVRDKAENDKQFRSNRSARRREYEKIKWATDPIYSFKRRIKLALWRAFRKLSINKSKTTLAYLGYSKQDLSDKLSPYIGSNCESCSDVIITMKNSHMDHIIPMCSAKSEEDVIKLNQLYNLRLICQGCNLKKIAADLLHRTHQ